MIGVIILEKYCLLVQMLNCGEIVTNIMDWTSMKIAEERIFAIKCCSTIIQAFLRETYVLQTITERLYLASSVGSAFDNQQISVEEVLFNPRMTYAAWK